MTHDELRGTILGLAAKVFGPAYTPSRLAIVEAIWDAAIEAAAEECRRVARALEGPPTPTDDRWGVASTAAYQCADDIRALKGTP